MSTSTSKSRSSKDLPASVDPAGVKQEAPMELKPSTSLQKWTPEIIRRVMTVDPLTTLPRSLIPIRKFRLRPPVMRYGWKVNRPKLLEYAEQHNLTYRYEPMKFCGLARDVGHDGSEDQEEGDDSDDEIPTGLSCDEAVTLERAVWHIVEEHNLDCLLRLLSVTWVVTRDPDFVISLYTNYDLAIPPSENDIETFRRALGEAEKPAWYLDFDYHKWRPWDY